MSLKQILFNGSVGVSILSFNYFYPRSDAFYIETKYTKDNKYYITSKDGKIFKIKDLCHVGGFIADHNMGSTTSSDIYDILKCGRVRRHFVNVKYHGFYFGENKIYSIDILTD